MANCWIFQANPKIFDIIGELEDSYELSHWTIRQHSAEVKYGDTVLIWKADVGEGNAGIYAVGRVISDVIPLPVIWGQEYWKTPTDMKVEPRALIKYTRKLVNAPILKTSIIQNSVLKDLKILKDWQHTVYPVTNNQYQELMNLSSI
ncbi:MAG: EVE domain-containing protein [Dehalococcoidales bacterium]|nr:EVE domain-containing protein [Dehalococcoidales bacterium]